MKKNETAPISIMGLLWGFKWYIILGIVFIGIPLLVMGIWKLCYLVYKLGKQAVINYLNPPKIIAMVQRIQR